MTIGFIGLGNMGGAIAQRLLETKPQPLCVYDLRPEAVERFVALGAQAAGSPREVAAESEVVLTCLPTSHEVRAVIFGPDGLLAGLAPDGPSTGSGQGVIADMTTGDPVMTREMADELAGHGVALIDAPVSGGPHGALAGTLAIIVGASDELFARCAPVFRAISPNVIHAGGIGAGHTMKLVNNTISAGNRAVAFEAVALAVRNGIDPGTCVDIIRKSTGRSYVSDVALPDFILSGAMAQGFTLGLMHKDLTLATKLGRDSDVPMALAEMVRETFARAVEEKGAHADISELIRLYERAAGVAVAGKKE